jgi:hypothetical protein
VGSITKLYLQHKFMITGVNKPIVAAYDLLQAPIPNFSLIYTIVRSIMDMLISDTYLTTDYKMGIQLSQTDSRLQEVGFSYH